MYENGLTDLYVLNVSSTYGVGYLIPKGINLDTKNSYRGSARNVFTPEGKINFNANVVFYSGMFASRITQDSNPDQLRVLKSNVLFGQSTLETEFLTLLNSEVALPSPVYYNMEDQARLAENELRDFDFDYYYSDLPMFRLADFKDQSTTFVTLEIEDDNLIGGRQDSKRIFNPLADNVEVGELSRKSICLAFMAAYEAVAQSIFSQVYIVFDIETGMFNINREMLKIRYGQKLSPDVITREYAYLVAAISPLADNYLEILTPYTMDILDPRTAITPTRITFYISDLESKIRLSSPGIKLTTNLADHVQYSASDSDEFLLKRASDGSLPYEYSNGGVI